MKELLPLVPILIPVGVLFAIALAIKYIKKTKIETHKEFVYRERKLLSIAEKKLFQSLTHCIEKGDFVLCKVRLEDIVSVDQIMSTKEYNIHRNRIKNRHVDFAIFEGDTNRIKCVIELDDRSHENEKAKKADDIKSTALKQAGIRLHRLKPKNEYSANLLTNLIYQ